jgi:hypothetical protein
MYSYTKTGATRLASKIMLYWSLRGVDGVQAWIEEGPEPEMYQVRSNIAARLNVNFNRHAKV